MKVEEGTVVSVFADGSAEVKVGRHSDCIACGACEGAKDIVVTAVNKVNAKEGQACKIRVSRHEYCSRCFLFVLLCPYCWQLPVRLSVILSAVLSEQMLYARKLSALL